MRTRVEVLRKASCEPPLVEPLPTLELALPRLPLPLNCGTVLRRLSRTLVLLPEFSMDLLSTVITGLATELAPTSRKQPLPSKFSNLTASGLFSAGAVCWAIAGRAANQERPAASRAQGRRRART